MYTNLSMVSDMYTGPTTKHPIESGLCKACSTFFSIKLKTGTYNHVLVPIYNIDTNINLSKRRGNAWELKCHVGKYFAKCPRTSS